MYYKNAETYLNEEFRKPIKCYLRGVDKKTVKKVMGVVDYLCDKYREVNGTALWYEEMADCNTSDSRSYKSFLRSYMNFMRKRGYLNPVDYDKLESPYTEEELAFLLDDDDFEGEDE